MAQVLRIGAKKKAAPVVVAPVKGKGKGKEAKAAPASNGLRQAGRTTGLSVLKYQNQTLEANRKARKTDDQLAQMWCQEHPNSKAVQNGNIDAAMVRAVRNQYNLGKHGNNDGEPLPNPIPEFDEGGQPLPFHGEKAAAKRELAEQKATIERVKVGKVKVKSKK